MLGYFPDPYPDELISSTWARLAEIMSCGNYQLHRLLFESKSYTVSALFPIKLQTFARNLPPCHTLTLERILWEHTTLPYYAPWLSANKLNSITRRMLDGESRVAPPRTANNRITNLRFCPDCAQDDRDKYGETYWHRIHQIPEVLVCPIHSVYLRLSSVNLIGKFNGVTAEMSIPHNIQASQLQGTKFETQLLSLAEEAQWLLQANIRNIEQSTIREKYRVLLDSYGFPLIGNYPDKIRHIFTALGAELIENYYGDLHFFQRRIKYIGSSPNPFEHILTLMAFEITVEEFLLRMPEKINPFRKRPWPCPNGICHQQRTAYLVYKNPYREFGYFKCEVCGILYRRNKDTPYHEIERIIDYGHLWKSSLIAYWNNEQEKLSVSKIAELLHADIYTVIMQAALLELDFPPVSNPDLCEIYYEISPNQMTGKRRETYSKQSIIDYLIRVNPYATHAEIREACFEGYMFLSNEHMEWLDEHLSLDWQPQEPNYYWQQLDLELEQRVDMAYRAMLSTGYSNSQQCFFSKLDQEMGLEEEYLLKHCRYLPKTNKRIVSLFRSVKVFGDGQP